jgi:lysophospholipase L1-like esterase
MSDPVRRYVALGDSLTEGVGDPVGRALRGWAALLAAALDAAAPGLQFSNLARRGAVLGQLRAEQLPAAVDAAPDLVTLVIGVNDVLTPGAFSEPRFAADLEFTVAALRATGARVMLARLHDPGHRLRLPGRLGEGVRAKVAALNAAVDATAQRSDALVLDLGARPEVRTAGVWSLDRLHPGEPGHRLLAAAAAELLRADGVAVGEVPRIAPPGQAGGGHRGHLRWLLTDGGPWLAGVQVQRLRLAAARRRAARASRTAGAGPD